jgi:uncharacterized SAM-binding protein YcdF (DUF218 family)
MKFTRTVRSRIIILAAVAVILILCVTGCRKAGSWLVKADLPAHADVMVLLTGPIADRVLQVGDLYRAGVSTRVWIVEPATGAAPELEKRGVHLVSDLEQIQAALTGLGVPQDSIVILPGHASSTKMEAEAVRDHLRSRPDIRSVLIVTSAEHTRRAFKLFRAAFHPLNRACEIYCSPSAYTGFHAEKWWKSKEDIQGVVYEYLKLVNFVFSERHALRKGQ